MMTKKFKITVDGRSYDVVVEEEGGGANNNAPHVAHVAPALAAVEAAAPVEAAPAPAPRAPAGPAGAGDVGAPLAGMVQSIEVRVGQAVNAGDLVAVIEAMKMKTEVFTKISGTVKAVMVKAGDSIGTDEPILSIG
jgi:glutaconyl-CoA/methylmalonyl-CoA decarboxylase subunit gamma